MQRLSPQELQAASEIVEEMILCILGQDDRWRPTTYAEMMAMM